MHIVNFQDRTFDCMVPSFEVNRRYLCLVLSEDAFALLNALHRDIQAYLPSGNNVFERLDEKFSLRNHVYSSTLFLL